MLSAKNCKFFLGLSSTACFSHSHERSPNLCLHIITVLRIFVSVVACGVALTGVSHINRRRIQEVVNCAGLSGLSGGDFYPYSP